MLQIIKWSFSGSGNGQSLSGHRGPVFVWPRAIVVTSKCPQVGGLVQSVRILRSSSLVLVPCSKGSNPFVGHSCRAEGGASTGKIASCHSFVALESVGRSGEGGS